MIIIDTNVLINSLIEDSQDHSHSLELLRNAQVGGEAQYVTLGVLIELGQVLFREKGHAFAAAQVANVSKTFEVLFLQDINAIIPLYLANHKQLSFVDCEIVALSREHGAKVISLDDKLMKALKS